MFNKEKNNRKDFRTRYLVENLEAQIDWIARQLKTNNLTNRESSRLRVQMDLLVDAQNNIIELER